MTDDSATAELMESAKKAFTKTFGAVIKLSPLEHATVWIDGRQTPPAICLEAPKGTTGECIWRGALDALEQAFESERSFESAFVSGRITISGDMGVMARLTMERSR